jgi:hypothetical protein
MFKEHCRMSWIDDGEQEYRARMAKQQAQDQIQLHRAEVVRVKARDFLDELVKVVARDVADYSQRFADFPERRVQFNPKATGGFKLEKPNFPSASVECSLKGDHIEAAYEYRTSNMSEPKISTVRLRFEVDAADNLIVKAGNQDVTGMDAVSEHLIRKVLFA